MDFMRRRGVWIPDFRKDGFRREGRVWVPDTMPSKFSRFMEMVILNIIGFLLAVCIWWSIVETSVRIWSHNWLPFWSACGYAAIICVMFGTLDTIIKLRSAKLRTV